MSASAFPPPIRRTVYVLTDDRGWVLYQLDGSSPTFTPDPVLAVRNGLAWLGREVAEHRRALMRKQPPQLLLGIATVELVQRASGWEAVSMVGGGLQ